jgi:hypothetical protein
MLFGPVVAGAALAFLENALLVSFSALLSISIEPLK